MPMLPIATNHDRTDVTPIEKQSTNIVEIRSHEDGSRSKNKQRTDDFGWKFPAGMNVPNEPKPKHHIVTGLGLKAMLVVQGSHLVSLRFLFDDGTMIEDPKHERPEIWEQVWKYYDTNRISHLTKYTWRRRPKKRKYQIRHFKAEFRRQWKLDWGSRATEVLWKLARHLFKKWSGKGSFRSWPWPTKTKYLLRRLKKKYCKQREADPGARTRDILGKLYRYMRRISKGPRRELLKTLMLWISQKHQSSSSLIPSVADGMGTDNPDGHTNSSQRSSPSLDHVQSDSSLAGTRPGEENVPSAPIAKNAGRYIAPPLLKARASGASETQGVDASRGLVDESPCHGRASSSRIWLTRANTLKEANDAWTPLPRNAPIRRARSGGKERVHRSLDASDWRTKASVPAPTSPGRHQPGLIAWLPAHKDIASGSILHTHVDFGTDPITHEPLKAYGHPALLYKQDGDDYERWICLKITSWSNKRDEPKWNDSEGAQARCSLYVPLAGMKSELVAQAKKLGMPILTFKDGKNMPEKEEGIANKSYVNIERTFLVEKRYLQEFKINGRKHRLYLTEQSIHDIMDYRKNKGREEEDEHTLNTQRRKFERAQITIARKDSKGPASKNWRMPR